MCAGIFRRSCGYHTFDMCLCFLADNIKCLHKESEMGLELTNILLLLLGAFLVGVCAGLLLAAAITSWRKDDGF